MADVQHKNITPTNMHGAVAYVVANAAARTALTGGIGAGDRFKLLFQEDTGELYILVNHSPVTWKLITLDVVAAGLLGGSGWDTTNQLGTAAGAGIRGHASGFWVAVHANILSAVNGAYLASCFDGTITGWRLYQDSATTLRFEVANGAGAFVASSAYTFTANKENVFVGVFTGTQVQLFAARAQVGSNAAITGQSPAAAGNRMTAGIRNNGTAAHTGARIYGIVGGDNSVPTLAEVQALSDAIKAGGQVVDIAGKTAHRWSVQASATPPNFPATLSDLVGSSNMTFFAGAASGVDLDTVATPDWAF